MTHPVPAPTLEQLLAMARQQADDAVRYWSWARAHIIPTTERTH